jgi:hypothetical protein
MFTFKIEMNAIIGTRHCTKRIHHFEASSNKADSHEIDN